MRDELEVAMRLVGVTDLAQRHPGLVSTLERPFSAEYRGASVCEGEGEGL